MKNIKLYALIVFFILLGEATRAQINNRCGVIDKLENRYPFSSSSVLAKSEVNLDELISIPVVIHVVWYHTDKADSIKLSQIESQIAVLNREFSKTDFSSVPIEFRSVAQTPNISFCLAKKAPDGSYTDGIKYYKVDRDQPWPTANDVAELKQTVKNWDPSKYLNIWVCDLENGISGYGSTPSDPSDEQGIVVDYTSFGTEGTAQYPESLGKTSVHEIGHWLGLRHIWNVDGDCIDDAQNGDGISDTPVQMAPTETIECPVFPKLSCLNSYPNGDMFMNYMDYSSDLCLSMFTKEQVKVMRKILYDKRASILNSDACTQGVSCQVPTNLAVANITSTTAIISWGIEIYAKAYQLEYRVVGGANWDGQTLNKNNITLTELFPNTKYEFRVSTVCDIDHSDFSEITEFETTGIVCKIPENFSANDIALTSAKLTWSNIEGVKAYILEYKLRERSEWKMQIAYTNSFYIKDLLPQNNYQFRVKTECSSAQSGYSEVVEFVTCGCEAPKNIGNPMGNTNSLFVTWDKVKFADYYIVEQRKKGDYYFVTAKDYHTELDWTENFLSNAYWSLYLDSGFDMEYRIKSKCGALTSEYSEIATFRTKNYPGCNDNLEPNNTKAEAKEIPFNTLIPAKVGKKLYNDYQDFYKIPTKEDLQLGIIVFDFNNNNAIIPQDLSLGIFTGKTSFQAGYYGNSANFVDGYKSDAPYLEISSYYPSVGCYNLVISDCASPKNVKLEDKGNNSIRITWDPSPNAKGYFIRFGFSSYETKGMIYTDANTNEVLLNNFKLIPGSRFFVKTICDYSMSPRLEERSAADYICAPLLDNHIKDEVTSSESAKIFCDFIAPEIVLYYRVIGKDDWVIKNSKTGLWILSGLIPQTKYEYKIEVTCENGLKASSGIYYFTTSPAACEAIKSIFVADIDTNAAKITWNEQNGAVSYLVHYKESRFRDENLWTSQRAFGNFAMLKGLSPNTEYIVIVETECPGQAKTLFSPELIFRTTNQDCTSFVYDPNPIKIGLYYPCDTRPFTISTLGGKLPLKYIWNNGSTESYIPGSQPGTYTVTITDANQCKLTTTIVVPKVDKPQVEIKAEPLSGCNAGYKLIPNVKIGEAPVIYYNWSDGKEVEQITAIKTGVYTLTVVDEIGCEASTQMEVKIPDALVLKTTITNADCSTLGQASVTASGGTLPYSYRWSNGATSTGITNLSVGSYSVTVSDAKKCEAATTLSVEGSVNNLKAVFSIKEYICDKNKGAITTTISGGSQPYTFKWSTGATTQNPSNLTPGTYSLTVSDQNKCTTTQTATLKERVCLAIYDPVCGSDGNEYANSCEAECAGVTWTKGPCSSSSSCKCSDPAAETICEDFQSYTTTSPSLDGLGIIGPQSACWTTWSGAEGGGEDGAIRHLPDGRKYLRIQRASPTPVPDVVMLLGNRTSGSYQLKFKLLIYPQDKGYFNILNVFTPGAGSSAVRAEEVFFTGNGAGYLKISGQSNVNFSYTTTSSGVWIDIVQDFDLSTGLTKLTIDNKVVQQWTMTRKTLRGINFYPDDASYRFFIDDISFASKEDCICPAVYDPVCGADGNTYSNACAANCAGVSIVPCIVCTPPAVSVSQITTSTARLSMSLPPNTQGSEIRVRQKGTSTWTLINLNTGVSSIGLSSLSPNTSYEYQVRVKCSSTVYSNYSTLQEFKTSATSSSDLIAHYPFNGNANDISVNNLHGTVTGAQLTTDRFGKASSAYQFNGSNQFISVADHPLLDIGIKDYTMVAWIKTTSSGFGRIVSKGSSGCTTGYMMRTGGSGASKVHLENAALSSCRVNYAGNTTINDGLWHCVVGVVSRATGASIYVDGSLDRQISLSTANLDLANTLNLTIGVSHIAGLPEWFNGAIDDVQLYSRALSAQEVLTLCQSSSGGLIPENEEFTASVQLKIYPNPTLSGTLLQVEYNAAAADIEEASIEIMDLMGKSIYRQRDEVVKGMNSYTINSPILPKGIYVVKLLHGQRFFTERLIVIN